MAFCCDGCMFTYDNIVLLRDHLRNMSSASSSHAAHAFVCPLCSVPPLGIAALFAGARAFADHIDTAHADVAGTAAAIILAQSSTAPLASSFPTSSAAAVPKRAGDPHSSRCVHCGRPFKRAWDLQRHLRTHTDERPFACDTCGRRFRLRTTLADHRRTHEAADAHAFQFQCGACAKHFLSRSALKLHMRAHTGEAPFPCAEASCTRMFRTKKLMLTHHRNDHRLDQLQQYMDIGESEQQRIDHDAKIAFTALANLNRTINGNGPSISVINQSEHSAFSNFKEHYQHQPLQQQQQQHSVQRRQANLQSADMLLITPATGVAGAPPLPPAVAGVLQHQLPLATPAINGIMIGRNNNNNNNNNNNAVGCWPPPIRFHGNNHGAVQQQLHHHHHYHQPSTMDTVMSNGTCPSHPSD